MQMRGTALVTGAAKRIGRAIAEDLAANGFAVVIHANRSFEAAEALAAELKDGGAGLARRSRSDSIARRLIHAWIADG